MLELYIHERTGTLILSTRGWDLCITTTEERNKKQIGKWTSGFWNLQAFKEFKGDYSEIKLNTR